jgi:hypothetical protein
MTRKDIIRGTIGGLVAGLIGFGAAQASNGLASTDVPVGRFVDPATGCHYLVAGSWRYDYAAMQPRMMANGRQFCQSRVPTQ